jgi:3-methyladenine DNA glycosylase AlkD
VSPTAATTRAATRAATPARPAISPTTAAANEFVAARLARATALGEQLGEDVADPTAFVATISRGFEALADPVYAEGNRRVTPGLGPTFGVRLPLMSGTHRAFKRATRKTSTALLIDVAARLLRQEPRELRWFAIWTLSRTLPSDPERTWQLLRATAASADEWITVDTLAHPYAEGILADARRWAEVEQLMYSPSRWERRLVGSTLAVMIHASSHGGRKPETVHHGLRLIGQLIGDNEPDVQKALSWPLRDFTVADAAAVDAFVAAEARTAARTNDGNRAWVIRDMLVKLPPDRAAAIRQALDGIRRAPGGPSTSTAAATAAAFMGAAAGTNPAGAKPVASTRED